MTKSGNRFAVLACVAFLLAAPEARATSPADIATARELYKEGADALDQGNASAAVEKLSAAWALLQTPVIGIALARAYDKLGQLIQARETALAIVRMPRAPDETTLSIVARNDADKLASTVAPRVPHVLIVLHGANPEDTNVKLDGNSIPPVALKVARQADPGTHSIVADTVDGRHVETTITLRESETKEAVVELPAAATISQKAPDTTPTVAPPLAVVSRERTTSPVVWIGVTIAGAGLVVGAIFGAITFGTQSSLQSKCTIASSDGKSVCPQSAASDLSFAQTSATISTIGFVALGVGAAVLVTGLFLGGRKSGNKAAILPMIGPVSGVAGVF